MKKCKVCGKNAHSDYCVRHKPRKIKNKNWVIKPLDNKVKEFVNTQIKLSEIAKQEVYEDLGYSLIDFFNQFIRQPKIYPSE